MSSGQMIAKLQGDRPTRCCPRGIVLEWTDLSYQQVTQSNAAVIVFPARRDAGVPGGWPPCTKVGTLPLAVILIVAGVHVARPLLGVWLSGGDNKCVRAGRAWWY